MTPSGLSRSRTTSTSSGGCPRATCSQSRSSWSAMRARGPPTAHWPPGFRLSSAPCSQTRPVTPRPSSRSPRVSWCALAAHRRAALQPSTTTTSRRSQLRSAPAWSNQAIERLRNTPHRRSRRLRPSFRQSGVSAAANYGHSHLAIAEPSTNIGRRHVFWLQPSESSRTPSASAVGHFPPVLGAEAPRVEIGGGLEPPTRAWTRLAAFSAA